jgi:thiamine pyrophosphate-dependent acetolactate synthase large subunit-like protein
VTVREAVFGVLRRRGLTTIFGNPGSTEIPFLVGLPEDIRFVLALHEGSVAGMATGWALARAEPALVLLHTTAGLGNAVGALATARVNKAPLVVLVGQQDRRHLAFEPFLAGRLEALAGEYPVSVELPVLAEDVPGAVDRAWHRATIDRGPAIVIVPMDDWARPTHEHEDASAHRIVAGSAVADDALSELAALVDGARSPALVVGADADDPETWAALVRVAERLACPVWQESFGARAGFPQDHVLFAGHLPGDRGSLRRVLSPHDVVLVVGAPVFRQYGGYAGGRLFEEGTRVALVTDDRDEAARSPAELVALADCAAVCVGLVERVRARPPYTGEPLFARPSLPEPPADGEPLRAAHVLALLAEHLPADAVLVEEAPSDRPELHDRIPARQPLGFMSAAMGGLGFGLPAAVGLRMALPERPVVAVLGDGSAMYAIQGLWSAGHYGVGAVFVVLNNGGYAVMDHLAERHGGRGPWPGFDVNLVDLARGLGCPAVRIETWDELRETVAEVCPDAAHRAEPLVLEVMVSAGGEFRP